jgi:3-deoxy-D-manno-octulosonic-acid transferase
MAFFNPASPDTRASRPFPPKPWLALLIRLYEALWHLLLPLVVLMLWRRGKKEPLYRRFWGERFGTVRCTVKRPVWVHSASMGEMRGAAPWVLALLEQGIPVFLTTLTPAGRQTAEKLFSDALQAGGLQMAYAPLELSWAVRRFLRRVQPRCAVMTEIDTWPVLLATIRRSGVPLAMANAQYPRASFERDQRWGGFRARMFQAYELVMCKSELQALRFRQVGCPRVEVVGETRFDLPVSAAQLAAAADTVRMGQLRERPVVCFASAIAGEDEIFIGTMLRMREAMVQAGRTAPLFVYVPRSPQRFDAVAELTQDSGLRTVRRSQALDAQLNWQSAPDWAHTDVLLGDSIGEMYFYIALSQVVVVGSSFGDRAVHNIIEPLALHKPVWTGPSVRGIEYPAIEALEAGVLHHAVDGVDLANQLTAVLSNPVAYTALVEKTRHFNAAHAGSVAKHMAAFLPWLQEREHP